MYSIPLFNLNFDEKEVLAATETIKNGWISMGPKCIEFEKKFAEKIGSKYSCAVANCTAALHLACISLGVKEGDEVICPSLTFAATVNCIRYVGAKPVFADIVAVPTPAQEGSDASMIGIAFLVICIAAASVFILKKILGK